MTETTNKRHENRVPIFLKVHYSFGRVEGVGRPSLNPNHLTTLTFRGLFPAGARDGCVGVHPVATPTRQA